MLKVVSVSVRKSRAAAVPNESGFKKIAMNINVIKVRLLLENCSTSNSSEGKCLQCFWQYPQTVFVATARDGTKW